MMAFGHTFESKEEARKLCSDILSLTEKPEWQAYLRVLRLELASLYKKFPSNTSFDEHNVLVGKIKNIEKVIALPDECRQLLNQ